MQSSSIYFKTALNNCRDLLVFCTYHGLIFIRGMGAHVKKTVSSKKDLRPHTSDNAPIRGALRNDNMPWTEWKHGTECKRITDGTELSFTGNVIQLAAQN